MCVNVLHLVAQSRCLKNHFLFFILHTAPLPLSPLLSQQDKTGGDPTQSPDTPRRSADPRVNPNEDVKVRDVQQRPGETAPPPGDETATLGV